jgi:hypothetical protein
MPECKKKRRSVVIAHLRDKDTVAFYLVNYPVFFVDTPGPAQYRSPSGVVKVVFLVLDLVQQVQRDAAKLAQDSNPRMKKKDD